MKEFGEVDVGGHSIVAFERCRIGTDLGKDRLDMIAGLGRKDCGEPRADAGGDLAVYVGERSVKPTWRVK